MSLRHRCRLTALLALLAAPAAAQYARPPGESPVPAPLAPAPALYATELEARLEARDVLIVEQWQPLAPLPLGGGERLVLEAVIASEYGREQERVLGVRATVSGNEGERIAYLDLHEVEDLLRALQSVPSLLEATPALPDGRIEIRHVTQDGFGLVLRPTPGKVERFVRIGSAPVAHFSLSPGAAEELVRQLDACRKFLFGS